MAWTRSAAAEAARPLAAHCAAVAAPVEVRASSIDGAGLGVFAAADLPPFTCLGVYTGEALTGAQLEERYPAGGARYVLAIGSDAFVDARDGSHWTRYVNSPRGTGRAANCTLGRGGVIATRERRVRRGAELFVSYGRCYSWAAAP